MKKRNKKAIIITAIVMLIGVLLILAGFLGNWFFGLFSKSFDSQNITSADIGRSIETDILVAYENIDLGDKTAQFVGNFNTGEGAFLLIDLSSLSEADKELYFSNYGQHITIKGTIKSVSDEELQEVFNKMYELYDPIFAERDSDMTLEEFHGYLTDPFIPYCIEITSIGTFNWTPFIPAGIIVFLDYTGASFNKDRIPILIIIFRLDDPIIVVILILDFRITVLNYNRVFIDAEIRPGSNIPRLIAGVLLNSIALIIKRKFSLFI